MNVVKLKLSNLKNLSKRKKTLLLIILILLAGATAYLLVYYGPGKSGGGLSESDAQKISDESIVQAQKGDYKGAAAKMEEAYQKSNDPSQKAYFANVIARHYFFAKDYDMGSKWMDIAINGYKSVGDQDKADSLSRDKEVYLTLKEVDGTESEPREGSSDGR